MFYFAAFLDRDFLPEDAEEGLLVWRHILAKYGFPQTFFRLEDILETWKLLLSRLGACSCG
jgi:hypothetical protein